MKIFYRFTQSVLLAAAVFACSPDASKAPETHPIDPPLGSVSIEFNRFELDAAEPKILRLASGSSLAVPANAFQDKDGNPVTGKVIVQYREFHSPADILLSGIPMTAQDENGLEKSLESGGMFELNASSASGQPLEVARGKKIGVNLASSVEGDFDFFYLEEQPVTAEKNTASFITEARANKELRKQYSWKKLYSPSDSLKKATEKKPENLAEVRFRLRFDTIKYPETAALDTIRWSYAGDQPYEDPSAPDNKFLETEKWTRLNLLQPKYKTRLQKEFRIKTDGTSIRVLEDSSGYIIVTKEENSAHLYDWNGQLKATYQDVSGIAHDQGNYLNIMPSPTSRYICFLWNRSHSTTEDQAEMKVFTKEGKLVYQDKDLPTYHYPYFSDNEERLISLDKENKNHKIIDLKTGKLKTTLPSSGYDLYNGYYQSVKNIVVVQENNLTVYDPDGKKLASTVLNENAIHEVLNSPNPDYYLLSSYAYSKNTLLVWDWKKNKFYESGLFNGSKDNDSDGNKIYYHNATIHPKEPIVLAYDGATPVIWNFRDNTKVRLDRYKKQGFYFTGNLLWSHDYNNDDSKRKQVVTDLKGKLIVELSEEGRISFSKDEKLMIVQTADKIIFRETGGKIIKNFTDYDSTLRTAFITEKNQVFTYNKDGMVSLWNEKGVLIRSTPHPVEGEYFAGIGGDENLFLGLTGNEDLLVYNFEGELLYVLSLGTKLIYEGARPTSFLSEGILAFTKNNLRQWKKTEEVLGAGTYLLSVKNENNDFRTYVTLTPEQKQLFAQYQKTCARRQKEEQKRMEEEKKLVRSFEINKMGIYNWDRFYKDSTSLLLAASFDFDTVGVEFNNITVFLVTGKDRTAVIKYPKEAWSKFSFNPQEENRLLAILPGQKIAFVKPEDFRALDLAKLKAEKAYKFKMSILTGVASEEMIREILNKPS